MTTDFDIVIIGAGIHGAGALQAAAARGYSALLVEQYERPAWATSSRSSKLIHGGLRYLEHGELKLVYECLRERRRLLRNAPELVRLKPFYIPVYRGNRRGPWTIRAGLALYSLLAGLGADYRFRAIPEIEWNHLGRLKRPGLSHVFRYADAQTDDAQLTRAVLRSAESLGARCQFNTRLDRARSTGEGYTLECTHTETGEQQHITAGGVVVAAGPWINHVMRRVEPEPSVPDIDLVQGTHIVLPGTVGDRIFYLEAPDGRAVFVMPWHDDVMVGTTEQLFEGDPAEAHPTPQEINYLLAVFNHYFPGFYARGPATANDILSRFAGLRVLLKDSENPFKRTRETVFIGDRKRGPRLVGIYGGKLTSYRAAADKALSRLAPQLPKRPRKADTRKLTLN